METQDLIIQVVSGVISFAIGVIIVLIANYYLEIKRMKKTSKIIQEEAKEYMDRFVETHNKNQEDQDDEDYFIAECNVCGNHLRNWVGSTPCCGSIAYIVEENGVAVDNKDVILYGSKGNDLFAPTKIKTHKGE